MSKKVCICGTDHGKEKPLVITITTCKNRHAHVECPNKLKSADSDHHKICTAACSSMSTIKSSKKSSRMKCTDSGTIDNLRYSSEEACPGPGPKGRGEPVSGSSICCDCGGDKRKKKKEKKKKEKKSKKSKKGSACDACCRPKEDKSLNCPSEAQVKLPILIPRYHGPGCAMEVDVLEKHDKNCKLKKIKNPKRNNTDDRAGSYEVIGRIVFKTCQPAAKEPPCKVCPQSAKLATVYSLFNIPFDYRESCSVDLSTKTNKERMRFLQKYLKHRKVLENLAKSSKSFPTILNKYDVTIENDNSKNDENVACQSCANNKKYEVEELYVSETKSNHSIRMVENDSERSKHKLRKWMYFFFPCFYSYESSSSMGCSELDMEYKNRRYEYTV